MGGSEERSFPLPMGELLRSSLYPRIERRKGALGRLIQNYEEVREEGILKPI